MKTLRDVAPESRSERTAEAFLSTARFVTSGASVRELPMKSGPEVAFAGRSNAGKSSAINTITRKRRLAYSSKTPGRTQLLNVFSVGFQGDDTGYIVDLPGYGFAAVPTGVKADWEQLVGTYVKIRPALKGLVLVMDARRPFRDLDLQLIRWANRPDMRWLGLMTKADKLTHSERLRALDEARSELKLLPFECLDLHLMLFSATSGLGHEDACAWISDCLGGPSERSSLAV